MIKYILFLIFSSLLHSKDCEKQYLEKVVNTSSRWSYYLVVKIEDKNSNLREMFITRNDFFHVLSFDSKFIKQVNKIEYVKRLIFEKRTFKIKNPLLVKQFFLPLATPDKRVDSLCKLGKYRFIDEVFDGGGLQKNMKYDLGYVVQKLFELRVPVMFYGEAGKLLIDRGFICK